MKKGDDQKDTIKTKGPRIIVFFLGGYTFPEVRVCYELAQELGRDIIIGARVLFRWHFRNSNANDSIRRKLSCGPEQIHGGH